MNIRSFRHTQLCAVLALGASLVLPAALTQETPPGAGSGPRGRMGRMTTHGLSGVVTAVSGNEITMEIPEGVAFTVEAGASTRVTKDGQAASVGDVQVGDAIMANGKVNEEPRTIEAAVVTIGPAEQARTMEQLKAAFGKLWTAGVVTAIQGDAITIRRRDHAMQTFHVDGNTIIRHERETMTLADVPVGARVNASIREKDGLYVANTVGVSGMAGGADSQGAGPGGTQPSSPVSPR